MCLPLAWEMKAGQLVRLIHLFPNVTGGARPGAFLVAWYWHQLPPCWGPLIQLKDNKKKKNLFTAQVLDEGGEEQGKEWLSSSLLCNLQEGVKTSSCSIFKPVWHIKPELLNIASNRPELPSPTMSGTSTTDPDLFATILNRTPARPLLTLGISHEITQFLGRWAWKGELWPRLKKIINQHRPLQLFPHDALDSVAQWNLQWQRMRFASHRLSPSHQDAD